jgi:branched-chain amino acid transport system ATP-binding protein
MTAVDGVSLKVESGAIAGLMGPNGAGKTTLFNVIAGTIKPSGGEILLDGAKIESEPQYARLGRGLGRTFQIPRPFPAMTVLENLLLAPRRQQGERLLPNLFGAGAVAGEEQQNVEKAMKLLKFVTLDRLAAEPARVLSGGQRKLLELARVMMADPKIILLDEPAAGINPSLIETIIARIVEINARGVTLLIIEHNVSLLARLCRQVFVMAEGRLVCQGSPGDVVRDRRVIDAYLGGGPG